MTNKTIKDMIEEMTQYYEAAGFSGVYERLYQGKSEVEIRSLYEVFLKELHDADIRLKGNDSEAPPF